MEAAMKTGTEAVIERRGFANPTPWFLSF